MTRDKMNLFAEKLPAVLQSDFYSGHIRSLKF